MYIPNGAFFSDASADIRAILQCTGGLRPFLHDNQQIFMLESTTVSVNQEGRPAKENDVIKWIRGRLQTSPRKIFSIPSLQTIVQKGQPGIRAYFAVTCPTVEKLREWFLQRTQLFKETPSGNIHLSEYSIPLSGGSPMWSTVDFFVKILDEQSAETLTVDWSCVFNYIFVAENPDIMTYVMGSYEESTFEYFFRSHPEQFGLEMVNGELKRCADPANSGMECPVGGIAESLPAASASSSDSPLAQSIESCKDFFNGRSTMSVAELQRLFHDGAPRPQFNFIQRNYPAERFVDFLSENKESFVLSDNRQKVQLRQNTSLWNGTTAGSGNRNNSNLSDVKRNPKFDKTLIKFFTDLLTMAAREQAVRKVDVEKLCDCVQFLPKSFLQYMKQAYQPPSQLFEGQEVFQLNKDRSMVGLKEKIALSSQLDTTAKATMSVNFFIDAFKLLAVKHNVRFIQPNQMGLLACLMNPAAQSYLVTSFGETHFRVLLHRFPTIFSESKTGNIYLKENLQQQDLKLDPSNEVITNIKAICSNVVEGSAIEFFLYEVKARRAYCYPISISWCSSIVSKASRSINSYINKNFPTDKIADFLIKFPAIFNVVPELEIVYLQKEDNEDFNNNADLDNNNNNGKNKNKKKNPSDQTSALRIETEELLIGLVAAQCLAKCDQMPISGFFELAKKCHLATDIDAILNKEIGENKLERLQALLKRFPAIFHIQDTTEKVALRCPALHYQKLGIAMETALSRIIKNVVIQQNDEQGSIPTIMHIYEIVQYICSDGLFQRIMRTLTGFLEFLDTFPAFFVVNGSKNTIAVRDYQPKSRPAISPTFPIYLMNVQTSSDYCGAPVFYRSPTTNHQETYSGSILKPSLPTTSAHPLHLPPGFPMSSVNGHLQQHTAATMEETCLRQWVDQKTAILQMWSTLSGLLRKFVTRMDVETITQFGGLQSLVNGLTSCVEELERVYLIGGGQDWVQAQKLIDLYDSKNGTFAGFALTAHKIITSVIDRRHCQRAACKCRFAPDVRDLESFVYFCQSIRFHLEEGPVPRVLTPSSSSSNSSTPDILNRKYC